MVELLPPSLESSLSFVMFSFCRKKWFNFSDTVAKWVKLKKWEKINKTIGEGVHENFHAVVCVAFQ